MGDSYETAVMTARAWFRPVVALWFALLLGGGLWLMPPNVHASLARNLGLAGVPNNVAIVCGGFALLGLVLGWVIAARVAAASAPRAFAPGFEGYDESAWADEDADEQPRRRRVFSAREDIGEEGIAISAPTDEEKRPYEEEFSVEDIPPVTPEEDFEAVYAGMEPDYIPVDEVATDADDAETVEVEPAAIEEPVEYEAEFVEIEEAEYEAVEPDLAEEAGPEPEHEPEPEAFEATEEDQTPLGDMSLDALLGRLEGAMEAHKQMVETSERAARQPAPQTIPITRQSEPAPETEPGLAEVSDDDPVIAFLRREASRRMPQRPAEAGEADTEKQQAARTSQTEAQAALRSALDRLGQTGHRE